MMIKIDMTMPEISLLEDLTCFNCQSKDFDTQTIERTHGVDTYCHVKAKCRHCKYVYISSPFKIIEPLKGELI